VNVRLTILSQKIIYVNKCNDGCHVREEMGICHKRGKVLRGL
jgi:hypothetical protein